MEINVNPKASEWILKQPWLSQFVNNSIADNNPPKVILSHLLGAQTWNTISKAFLWKNTPEGKAFWSKIDDEMIEACGEENWEDYDTTIEI